MHIENSHCNILIEDAISSIEKFDLVQHAIDENIEKGCKRIVINIMDGRRMLSHLIGSLLRVKRQGIEVELLIHQEEVFDILKDLKLHEEFTIVDMFDSKEEG